MTVLVVLLAGEAFGGERVLENTVRLLTMLVGFPLALIAVKFGTAALRNRDWSRGWGSLSYGFMALVPAVGRAMNFGNPVNWVTTALYVAGMIAGGLALYHRATVSAWWTNRRSRRAPRGDR